MLNVKCLIYFSISAFPNCPYHHLLAVWQHYTR